jgi:hypothetical protein
VKWLFLFVALYKAIDLLGEWAMHELTLAMAVAMRGFRASKGKCADCTPERKCPDHGSCLVEDVGQD